MTEKKNEPTDKQVPDFEWIFDLHFAEVMKQGSPSGFKRDYATLWNHVILPAVKEHVEPLKNNLGIEKQFNQFNKATIEGLREAMKEKNGKISVLEEEVKKLKEERDNFRIPKQFLPYLEKGDKLKIYGKETKFDRLEVGFNEAFGEYEIYIWTTGRADPFYRTLENIEIMDAKKAYSFWSPENLNNKP